MDKTNLVFATGNINKVLEIRALLEGLPYEVTTMGEIGFTEDIPETGKTLSENAIIKAKYMFEKTGHNIIAEDTGLIVDALNGNPGVHTARYAGEEKDPDKNMALLLLNLEGSADRSARFHTVIALILDGEVDTFDGISEGEIAMQKAGSKGFGYDPIFVPKNHTVTFAEMDMKTKSKLSHRGRALENMLAFLAERGKV